MSINSSVFLHQRYQYFSFIVVLNSKRVLQEEKVCNYKKKKYMKENFEGDWTKTRSSFYLGLCGETQLPVVARKKDIAAFRKWFEPRSFIYLFRIWSSGRNESWEGLLVVTDISTSWVEVIFLDSEGNFRSGWWNVSHHQQSFSRLISPERSNSTLAQLDFRMHYLWILRKSVLVYHTSTRR